MVLRRVTVRARPAEAAVDRQAFLRSEASHLHAQIVTARRMGEKVAAARLRDNLARVTTELMALGQSGAGVPGDGAAPLPTDAGGGSTSTTSASQPGPRTTAQTKTTAFYVTMGFDPTLTTAQNAPDQDAAVALPAEEILSDLAGDLVMGEINPTTCRADGLVGLKGQELQAGRNLNGTLANHLGSEVDDLDTEIADLQDRLSGLVDTHGPGAPAGSQGAAPNGDALVSGLPDGVEPAEIVIGDQPILVAPDVAAAELQAIPPERFAELAPEQILAFTPAQIHRLTCDQRAALRPNQLRALSAPQLQVITTNNVTAISAGRRTALRPDQVSAPSARQITALTPDQIAKLDAAQPGVLADADLRPAQTAKLTDNQRKVLRDGRGSEAGAFDFISRSWEHVPDLRVGMQLRSICPVPRSDTDKRRN